MNIETILRHIGPNEARRSRVAFHDPSLRMRARLAAQATVRVPCGTDGRGTSLFLGLSHPRGLPAPVHRYDCRLLRVRQWQDTTISVTRLGMTSAMPLAKTGPA